MNIITRFGWILVGVVVGAIGTSSLGAVKQQTVSHAPDSSRLVVSLHSATVGQAAFVKDTKSEGCWIVITKNDGLAIAPAPIPACQ
jgi:hypothetical protein